LQRGRKEEEKRDGNSEITEGRTQSSQRRAEKSGEEKPKSTVRSDCATKSLERTDLLLGN
jgi:hypothetical protein